MFTATSTWRHALFARGCVRQWANAYARAPEAEDNVVSEASELGYSPPLSSSDIASQLYTAPSYVSALKLDVLSQTQECYR